MRRLLPALAFLVVPVLALAQESPDDIMARVMESPTSTGLLITDVDPGSQANSIGLQSGDILTTYDGRPTPNPEALKAALGALGDKETIAIEVDRLGEAKKFELKKGKIGIAVMPVEKAVRVDPLPADSTPKLDWTPFDAAGELWLAFHEGDRKAGFEHITWTRKDGVVAFRHEVAFDGGEAWGLNQFLVDEELTTADRAGGLKSRYENVLTHHVSEGKVVNDPKAPSAGWETAVTPPDAREPQTERHFSPGDLVPTYGIFFVARALPKAAGTCYRFHPVEEGTGRIMHSSALVVAGRQKAKLGDREIEGWQVEWRVLGRPANLYWFDDQGTLLAVSYGAAYAVPSTKEEALAGLHPDLKPKTE